MRKSVYVVFVLLLLAGCATDELPPTPPPPGGTVYAGAAVGGIPIPESLPAWASIIKHSDVTPTVVKHGDKVIVTVEKPADLKKTFLILEYMYSFNSKYRIWEKVPLIKKDSGKVLGGFGQTKWVKDKSTFEIPIATDRFTTGANYLVTYWCINTGQRDSEDQIIWDCNGDSWGLGRFDVQGPGWPDILIESDIENNRYQESVKEDRAEGTAFTAKYKHLNGVPTDVEVLDLANTATFKEALARQLSVIEPKWGKRGQVCGFLTTGTDISSYSWLSGDWWLTVTTESTTPDDAKIGKYGIKYPSDCLLLDSLKQIASGLPGSCGNGVTEAGESCDMYDDAACPGSRG